MKKNEKYERLDVNAYCMRKTFLDKACKRFNEYVMPILAEFGIDDEQGVADIFHKMNDEGEPVSCIIDYAVEYAPIPSMPTRMHRSILTDSFYNFISVFFPHWRRYVFDDPNQPRQLPRIFTRIEDEETAFIRISAQGLSVDADALRDAHTFKPTEEQMELITLAEKVCEKAGRVNLDKLFQRRDGGWELNLAGIYPFTNYVNLQS